MVCYLLLVWMTLMSIGVNAHVNSYDAHETFHIQDQAFQEAQNQATTDAITPADASHTDICYQSHCGHGHTTGMLNGNGVCIKTDTAATVPTHRASWASSPIACDIERPKWPFTTPAVVNLLS